MGAVRYGCVLPVTCHRINKSRDQREVQRKRYRSEVLRRVFSAKKTTVILHVSDAWDERKLTILEYNSGLLLMGDRFLYIASQIGL
jgi:hypothetical protein